MNSGLNHPNVVRLLGIHTSVKGDAYIVTEFVSLGSLSDVIERNPLSDADALHLYLNCILVLNSSDPFKLQVE